MGMNLYWYKTNPSMDFFLPHTRVWELLCGAILAWGNLHWKEKAVVIKAKLGGEKFNHALSVSGFILFAVSICITKEKHFPGLWAILPIVATVLIIMAGKDAVLNRRILSNKVLVWFGLISYPMYLWHWPMISLYWIGIGEAPTPLYSCIVFLICTIFSWITTRFIEKPLRFGSDGKRKTIGLFCAMVLIGVIGCEILLKQGFPRSLSEIEEKNRISKLMAKSENRCNSVFTEWKKKTASQCRFQKEEGQNTIALIGDSHAGHLYFGLTQVTKEDEGIVVFPASAAAPFLDVMTFTASGKNSRKFGWQLHREAFNYIFNHPEIKVVVLAHRPYCSFNDVIDRQNPSEHNPRRAMENGMRRTFDALQKAGKRVIVVLDNPELNFEPQSCVDWGFFKPNSCNYSKEVYEKDEKIAVYNKQIYKISKNYRNISLVDLSKILCDDKKCYASNNGKVLYMDNNHLNNDGSLFVAPYIIKEIRNIYKR